MNPWLAVCLCRRPRSPGGAGGGGAGGDRPPDGGLAGHPDPLPGAPAQLSHHLLPPRLRHPPQAVGAAAGSGPAADHTLLPEGQPARLPLGGGGHGCLRRGIVPPPFLFIHFIWKSL